MGDEGESKVAIVAPPIKNAGEPTNITPHFSAVYDYVNI